MAQANLQKSIQNVSMAFANYEGPHKHVNVQEKSGEVVKFEPSQAGCEPDLSGHHLHTTDHGSSELFHKWCGYVHGYSDTTWAVPDWGASARSRCWGNWWVQFRYTHKRATDVHSNRNLGELWLQSRTDDVVKWAAHQRCKHQQHEHQLGWSVCNHSLWSHSILDSINREYLPDRW